MSYEEVTCGWLTKLAGAGILAPRMAPHSPEIEIFA